MKNLIKNLDQKNNVKTFGKFQTFGISKIQESQIKGGADVIIEEVIDA